MEILEEVQKNTWVVTKEFLKDNIEVQVDDSVPGAIGISRPSSTPVWKQMMKKGSDEEARKRA